VAVTTSAKRSIVWAFTIGLGLILLASGILVFAEATAIPDEAKRCAPSIWQSQWPRYLGCAMTTHDGLAGGLIAAGGALFAAWLAIDAIQQQTSRGSDRQKLEQAEEWAGLFGGILSLRRPPGTFEAEIPPTGLCRGGRAARRTGRQA
jgi:hypothetical protein